jgi:valyl-tRNA synthetase
VFKQLHEKGLVYRGFKVMPFSTACSTSLSNFEAGLNYKDVDDPAVMVSSILVLLLFWLFLQGWDEWVSYKCMQNAHALLAAVHSRSRRKIACALHLIFASQVLVLTTQP